MAMERKIMTETQAKYETEGGDAMTFDKGTIEELDKPLNPALTKTLKGNRYLEGHTIISQANRIFGYDSWGYDIVDVQLQRIENIGDGGEVQHAYAYSATVTVTVAGAHPRTDIGFNTVQKWKTGYTPEAHDTAMKGAVTDALKRALRSFGHQFGNSLYGDGTYDQKVGNGQEQAQEKQAPPPQQKQQQPSSNGQQKGKDAGWMGEESKEVKADGKLLAEIQKLGAQVYGQAEWVNGKNQSAAGWASGERTLDVTKLTQVEATKLSNGLRKRAEGAGK